MAGAVKKDNLGVGAQKPGEVTADDDIYEQYKKRMMLGYRHRPNPLVKLLHLQFYLRIFFSLWNLVVDDHTLSQDLPST